jgi:hypothetical protein
MKEYVLLYDNIAHYSHFVKRSLVCDGCSRLLGNDLQRENILTFLARYMLTQAFIVG